eukprot:scaffold14194_cov242-Isochrysis_galbana.AAC.4
MHMIHIYIHPGTKRYRRLLVHHRNVHHIWRKDDRRPSLLTGHELGAPCTCIARFPMLAADRPNRPGLQVLHAAERRV